MSDPLAAQTTTSRTLILLLRLALAWVFLYAASHQVFVANFSIAGFLNSTKTFHGLFAPLTTPGVVNVVSFLVAYGHLLIGLSLLSGLLVRVSSIFGIAIMLIYWMAHMDFPYISDPNNLLVDEHIVYALVLGLLIATHAGHIFGLDGWVGRQQAVHANKWLDWATA
jgi:thiosulfate dehydrogenase [quinone] large subunit